MKTTGPTQRARVSTRGLLPPSHVRNGFTAGRQTVPPRARTPTVRPKQPRPFTFGPKPAARGRKPSPSLGTVGVFALGVLLFCLVLKRAPTAHVVAPVLCWLAVLFGRHLLLVLQLQHRFARAERMATKTTHARAKGRGGDHSFRREQILEMHGVHTVLPRSGLNVFRRGKDPTVKALFGGAKNTVATHRLAMDRHRHGVGVGIKFHPVLRAVVGVGGFFFVSSKAEDRWN